MRAGSAAVALAGLLLGFAIGAPAPAAASPLPALLADRLGPRVPGTNTWIGQPERFLEELERAKSART